MKKFKGFTLVELVIVIIIVGILSLVAVPIYKKYVFQAQVTEAKALGAALATAERIYWTENGFYYENNQGGESHSGQRVSYDKVMGIDARSNKYFTAFWLHNNGSVSGLLIRISAYDRLKFGVGMWMNAPGSSSPAYFVRMSPACTSYQDSDGKDLGAVGTNAERL